MANPGTGDLPANPRGDWFYCFEHGKVETREECDRGDRLGPYETREEAEHWRERVAARNGRWEEDDEDDDR